MEALAECVRHTMALYADVFNAFQHDPATLQSRHTKSSVNAKLVVQRWSTEMQYLSMCDSRSAQYRKLATMHDHEVSTAVFKVKGTYSVDFPHGLQSAQLNCSPVATHVCQICIVLLRCRRRSMT